MAADPELARPRLNREPPGGAGSIVLEQRRALGLVGVPSAGDSLAGGGAARGPLPRAFEVRLATGSPSARTAKVAAKVEADEAG